MGWCLIQFVKQQFAKTNISYCQLNCFGVTKLKYKPLLHHQLLFLDFKKMLKIFLIFSRSWHKATRYYLGLPTILICALLKWGSMVVQWVTFPLHKSRNLVRSCDRVTVRVCVWSFTPKNMLVDGLFLKLIYCVNVCVWFPVTGPSVPRLSSRSTIKLLKCSKC